MDGTVGRYLSLLRQGLWGAEGRPSDGPAVPVGEKDGENLTVQAVEGEKWQERENVVRKVGEEEFAMAQQQSTTGLVIRFSEEERYQDELLFLRFTWHLHVSVLGEIKAKLDGAGIPFVLLKGLGCDYYYPEYGLRNLGDIDIYVGEENYLRAAEVFGCDAAASRSPKHFTVTLQDVTVEVHRTCEILPSRRADRHFRELASAGLFIGPGDELGSAGTGPAVAETGAASDIASGSDAAVSGSAAGPAVAGTMLNIGGVEVRTPQDDFNAIYLFVHFFDHFLGGGCGLRQVCDWALFLHAKRDTLDRSYLAAALKDLGLTNAWRTFGALAVHHLGLPAEEMPLYDAAASWLSAECDAEGARGGGLRTRKGERYVRRMTRRSDRLLRVLLAMGNFGKVRKQERRRKFGMGFFSRKLGSLLGALHHSFEMLALFPGHSLRGISHTLVTSTVKSVKQLAARA